MPTYKEITTKERRNHVLKLLTGKGQLITLVNYYNPTARTYAGYYVEAPLTTMRGFLNQYPDFLQECCEHEPIKWAEANGFKCEELTDFETITLNALY